MKTQKLIVSCFVTLLVTVSSFSLFAQNEEDAFRFSEIDWQGSARFMGAGKAFGAVGAEFAALATNPASIGLYKKNEVSITPLTLAIYKNKFDYNNTGTLAEKVKYNLGSAGFVWAIKGKENSDWKRFQIGFGFNRIMNYNNELYMEGRSINSSIGADFAWRARNQNVNDPDNITDETWIAWESYLINNVDSNYNSYYSPFQYKNMFQKSSVTRKGGNDEMVFSVGTNYKDKIFLGATIGVPIINFTENRYYYEENDKYQNEVFQWIKITDKLKVSSTGINLKLGIIYQPIDLVRIGVSFHTPTYYGSVRDYFERSMSAKCDSGTFDVQSLPNSFHYSLTAPLRFMVNAAFFIQKRAFISLEYELVNYGSASMYSGLYNFSEENQGIKETYRASHIFRLGAEINLNQKFMLRAGYNYKTSPYKDKINDASVHTASAGLGFRGKMFFGDIAYNANISKAKYWMYSPEFVNPVNGNYLTHRIVVSGGVKF